MGRHAWLVLCAGSLLALNASCYETHRLPGEGIELDAPTDAPEEMDRPRWTPSMDPLPARPEYERPLLPPIACTAQPAPQCTASFPRIMIVMDASSSMLAGLAPGETNWDKARFALAGNPNARGSEDPGFLQPAFARELDVRGNLVTMEDVFHLGLIVWNARDLQRLVLQYTPCARDNIAWAMDPYVSCDPPGCSDPYAGEPIWTYKNSDVDRDPPFVETTLSYVPPCNSGGQGPCVGNMFNTYTAEGLQFTRANIESYRMSPDAELSPATRFANILITDGETSPDSIPNATLQQMASQGIPTYVIGLYPQGPNADPQVSVEQLDRYAELGGTGYATLVPADGRDIADAFAEAVTRIIDEIGTDPCCLPTHCSENSEPAAP